MTEQVAEKFPPNKIALIIDGIVEDIIHCPDRLAALLLSAPEVIDITNAPEDSVKVGYTKNSDGSFSIAAE